VAFSLNRFSQIGFANFAHSWWFLLLPQRAQKDTSPCLAFAKTSLSLRKERDVAERQGEVKNGLLCELCAFFVVSFFLPQKAQRKNCMKQIPSEAKNSNMC
jgi:hypothetical protein